MAALFFLLVFLPVHANASTSEPAQTPKVFSTMNIARMLASGNADKQREAQQQLKELGQAAMPGLICVRRAGFKDQRIGAVIGMALLPMPELAMDGLVEALADPDPVVRSLAAHALAQIGTPAAPVAAKLLDSDNHDVQIGAGFALSLMGAQAVPSLAKSLTTDDTLVRAKIAWILGRMGPEATAAVPALIRALNTDDPRLMHVVAEAIDLIGGDPAMISQELLLIGVEHQGCPFRLKRLGGAAAPALVALLSRPGTPMAQISLYALSQAGREAAPALKKALKNGTPGQQAAAALILNHLDPTTALSLPAELRESLAGAHKSE